MKKKKKKEKYNEMLALSTSVLFCEYRDKKKKKVAMILYLKGYMLTADI